MPKTELKKELEEPHFKVLLSRDKYLDSIAKSQKYGFKNTNNALKEYNQALELFFSMLLGKKSISQVLHDKELLNRTAEISNSLF